jgi:2-dehydropantoate 2-reductase
MKVGVVGAGAMGSIFGAAFTVAGNETWLIDSNPATLDAIRTRGIVVERRDGKVDRYSIPATDRPTEIPHGLDLVVFQVKGFATASAAKLVEPAVNEKTIVLTLQNGLGNEEVLREVFPRNPILIGNSLHSSLLMGPGRVHHTGVRPTYIGPTNKDVVSAADRTGAALKGSGFEVCILSEDAIRHQIWAKFVTNCGSLATSALTGLACDAFNEQDDLLELSDALVRETCAIAVAAGYLLDVDDRIALSRDLYRTSGGKPSMLQDIEAGRRTEIDTINGAAVKYADKYAVPAPLNRSMVALVRGREVALGVV